MSFNCWLIPFVLAPLAGNFTIFKWRSTPGNRLPKAPNLSTNCTWRQIVRFTAFLICIITGITILKWVIEFPIFNPTFYQMTTNRRFLSLHSHPLRAGTFELPVCGWTDAARVLQVDPVGQGHGTVVEEVDLQDYLAARRSRARVLQVAQLPGAARIGGGSLHAAPKYESLLRGRLMWTDDVNTTR